MIRHLINCHRIDMWTSLLRRHWQIFIWCLCVGNAANVIVAADIAVGDEVILSMKDDNRAMGANPATAFGKDHYLVVWSEGFATIGGRTRILAARVSADGKGALTNNILAIAPNDSSEAFQDRPRVAFCKGVFLVVWQDFRNGKDYDILGVRVSSEGNLLDAVPFTIAGGGGNQARPDIATDGDGFLVVWQSHPNSTEQLAYKIFSASVGIDAAVGIHHEILDQPQAAIAWNGDNYLVIASGIESGTSGYYISTRIVGKDGNPSKTSERIPVSGRNMSLSISGQPAKGWLIVSDRVRPDAWGWAGPGASRCFFVGSNGKLADDFPAEPSVIDSTPPNWLDRSIKSKPTGLTPLGASASIWTGSHFAVAWQRFRMSYKGFALPLDDCNLIIARVDGWRPIDDKGLPAAATPAEESSPSLASSSPGKLLLVYSKGMPDGKVHIASRAIEAP